MYNLGLKVPPTCHPTFSDIFRHFLTIVKISFLGLFKEKYLHLSTKNSHKAGDKLD